MPVLIYVKIVEKKVENVGSVFDALNDSTFIVNTTAHITGEMLTYAKNVVVKILESFGPVKCVSVAQIIIACIDVLAIEKMQDCVVIASGILRVCSRHCGNVYIVFLAKIIIVYTFVTP